MRPAMDAKEDEGRLPRGGVDRNRNAATQPAPPIVASRAEAWIETRWS